VAAVAVLRHEYGDEIANGAIKVSLASVERSFRKAGRPPGAVLEAIGNLTAKGAITVRHTTQIHAVAANRQTELPIAR
jgi:hypothetical protein